MGFRVTAPAGRKTGVGFRVAAPAGHKTGVGFRVAAPAGHKTAAGFGVAGTAGHRTAVGSWIAAPAGQRTGVGFQVAGPVARPRGAPLAVGVASRQTGSMRSLAPALVALVLPALPACKVVTPAQVARFEPSPAGPVFRACQITLRWTAAELVEACGAPDAAVRRAGQEEERCYLYRSFGQGLGVSWAQSAPWQVVCLEPRRVVRNLGPQSAPGLEGIPAEDGAAWQTVSVYGLSDPGALETGCRAAETSSAAAPRRPSTTGGVIDRFLGARSR